jgi:Helicase HerA, central domain
VNDEPEGTYQKLGHPAERIGLAAVAALGLEAVLPSTGAPGWVLPASEIVASAGAAVVTWGYTGRKLFPAYMAALGAFLGGWTAWAGVSGLWHWSTFGGFLTGMATLVPLGVAAWHGRKPKAAPADPFMITAVPEPLMITPEPDDNEVQRGLFATMFAAFGIYAGTRIGDDGEQEVIPVTVSELTEERWGRKVRITLPRSGKVTIEDFRAKARNFEVALKAQEGAVMFENGATSSDVIMKVREQDGMAGTRLLTPEVRSRTCTEDVVVGVQEDGSYLKVPVREVHIMIVGSTGSGKSNLVNVLIAQLASCVDTVIWAIDMKGGRAIKPWFQAWEEGRTGTPPIDWIATTRAEAEMMIEAVISATGARMTSGVGRNKIKPTAGRPQIILVCDEMADLFSDISGTRGDVGEEAKTNTWFIKQGVEVTRKGRSEAVTTIWASQRGTTSAGGSTDMKANIDVRFALRPSQESELQWIVPDLPHLAARQLTFLAQTPGVGMMGRGPRASQPSKFLWHDHIDDVCGEDEDNPLCPPECPVYQTEIDTAPVRPRLDVMTARALGTDYAQRWARAQRDGVLRVPAMALSAGSALNGYGGDSGSDDFDAIIKGAGLEDPDKNVHPGRIRMREVLAARPNGASVRVLMDILEQEGIGVVRETVHKWLREDRTAELAHHPKFRCWMAGPGPNYSSPDGDDD